MTENKYLMKSGKTYYFRIHATPERKARVIRLGRDVDDARKQRDQLAVTLGLYKPAHA